MTQIIPKSDQLNSGEITPMRSYFLDKVCSCPVTNYISKSCHRGCDGGQITNSYSNGDGNLCHECSWLCFPCAIVIDVATFPFRIIWDNFTKETTL